MQVVVLVVEVLYGERRKAMDGIAFKLLTKVK